MSSQEMDCSEPLSQNAEEEEPSQSNTVEMTSASNSLESNMDLSEPLEDEKEDGSEDQDDQTNSSHNNSSSDESPPSQDQSPISVKLSYTHVKVISPNKNQEGSSDYGSQDVEENASCRVKSPITLKFQTTSTNGSQEVSPDKMNGNLEVLVNGETEISITLLRENSNEKCRNLKRKSGTPEGEVGKEKKCK